MTSGDKMAAQRGLSAGVTSVIPKMSAFPTMDCDVLTTEACSGSDEEEEKSSNDHSISPEFNTLWKTAMEKPQDFSAWTKLVTHAENEKNLAACREVYDAFLMRFPLCHIYWKKYANLEKQFGDEEAIEKVFHRAVQSNPLNVNMWINYIQYLNKTTNRTLPKCVDKLRCLYKEAVKASGMEFHADELWKLYINFEIQQKNFKDVTALFDRVLTIPTQQHHIHHVRFKSFVSHYTPTEILSTEELDWICSRIRSESDNDQIAAEDLDDCVDPLTESDVEKVREHILKVRKQLYLINKAEVKKRWNFEKGIKRLYFNTTPINVKQLNNWRKYLEFEVSEGQHERIVFLYERCLMTCALYEEFWLSYVQYLEDHSVEDARSVFERACRIHLPLKYSLHLQWSAFEEKHGCLDSARAILCHLENVIPELAIVRLKRVNLERRNGNLQEAVRLLKESVQISAGTKLSGFYAVKLSRLILKLQRDPHKAKDVLSEALKKDPDNPVLHVNMLEVEMARDDAEDAPLVCVEQALKRNLPDYSKKILSQRRLEYLEDFGNSLTSWIDAYNEHQTYIKRQKGEGKKYTSPKTDSVSEDCYPPGVSPPPEDVVSEIPPQNASAPAEDASVTENTAIASSSSSVVSSSNANTKEAVQYSHLSEHYPHSYYYSPRPAPQPYFNPVRTYHPPPYAPAQQFFRNQFPPGANMYHNFQPPMGPPSQVSFSGPPFMNNSGMPYRFPPVYGYESWFQNCGPQPWNRFFPPQ